MMIETPPTLQVPLQTDEHGKIRIKGTRVLLELIIHAYYQGETPEGIVESYPTLKTGDVYAIIAYYLEHHNEVDAYVREQDAQNAWILRELEAGLTPQARALRTRLKALRDSRS